MRISGEKNKGFLFSESDFFSIYSDFHGGHGFRFREAVDVRFDGCDLQRSEARQRERLRGGGAAGGGGDADGEQGSHDDTHHIGGGAPWVRRVPDVAAGSRIGEQAGGAAEAGGSEVDVGGGRGRRWEEEGYYLLRDADWYGGRVCQGKKNEENKVCLLFN